MGRFRLLVAYDGAPYHGWQLQPDVRTVQGELQAAIARIAQRPIQVQGASRTDAGVHSLGQVAHLDYDGRLAPDKLRKALNAVAHEGVRVMHLEPCDARFHARFDAHGKLYRYHLWADRVQHPLHRHRCLHVRHRLDLEAMRRAAADLIGYQDFTSLRSANCDAPSSYVSLYRVAIQGQAPHVRIEVEGAAFLKYMVRSIVGTLLEVGRGTRHPESMPELLEARDRSLGGVTAKAHGLHLVWVRYAECPWASGATALTSGELGVHAADAP